MLFSKKNDNVSNKVCSFSVSAEIWHKLKTLKCPDKEKKKQINTKGTVTKNAATH